MSAEWTWKETLIDPEQQRQGGRGAAKVGRP